MPLKPFRRAPPICHSGPAVCPRKKARQGRGQRHDTKEHAADAAPYHKVAKDSGGKRRNKHGQYQRRDRRRPATHDDRQHAVAVPGDAEEERLAECQHTAVAPDQAEAERHEYPDQKVREISDIVGISEDGIDQGHRQNSQKCQPKSAAVAVGLWPIDET